MCRVTCGLASGFSVLIVFGLILGIVLTDALLGCWAWLWVHEGFLLHSFVWVDLLWVFRLRVVSLFLIVGGLTCTF